jgi:hypothetical protein
MRQLTAPFDTYDQLIEVIRHRIAELDATCESVSELAGLSTTHTSRIVNPKRSRILGRMSLSVILQTLGIKLTATVDDEAYAPLRERLPQAKFNRWPERAMKISVGELGGEEVVKGVPELLAAVSVPVAEPKPKPEVKRPRYNPDEPHPLPVRSRSRFGRCGHGFGRAQRSASAA